MGRTRREVTQGLRTLLVEGARVYLSLPRDPAFYVDSICALLLTLTARGIGVTLSEDAFIIFDELRADMNETQILRDDADAFLDSDFVIFCSESNEISFSYELTLCRSLGKPYFSSARVLRALA